MNQSVFLKSLTQGYEVFWISNLTRSFMSRLIRYNENYNSLVQVLKRNDESAVFLTEVFEGCVRFSGALKVR